MTKLEDLFVASNDISLEEAQQLLKKSKKKRLPIIDKDGHLVSLICRRDILNQITFPKENLIHIGFFTRVYPLGEPALLFAMGSAAACLSKKVYFRECSRPEPLSLQKFNSYAFSLREVVKGGSGRSHSQYIIK